jgi:hypothetical protein
MCRILLASLPKRLQVSEAVLEAVHGHLQVVERSSEVLLARRLALQWRELWLHRIALEASAENQRNGNDRNS